MFDKECFIEECRAPLREQDAQEAMLELVARVMSEPEKIVQALGEPNRAGVNTLYKQDDLTVLNLCWGPGMEVKPHDHRMWAVIGIYAGREQNYFYRRSEQGLEDSNLRLRA
jgi:predicted metal-dependent enzyme (double-stranded beta helix superfamily)